jgi:hypothetical protein
MSTQTTATRTPFPPPPASARRPRASRTGYWAAVLVAVVALAAGLTWGIGAITNMRHTIDAFARAPIPGSVPVELPASTGQVIYYEGPGAVSATFLQLEVTGPDAARIGVRPYGQTVEYEAPGFRHGRAVATFDTTVAGTYTIRVHARAPGAAVAVGDSFVRTAGWQVAAAVILVVAGLGTAAILALVTAVRRSP